MKELEVILKAIAGEIKWVQAADILDVSPRTIRRKVWEYHERGVEGLVDRRCGRPSAKRAPYEVVETVLKLFRGSYHDFNVKHFHEKLIEIHGIVYSYTWVKNLLQEAGYVKRGKGHGGHRKRRERRPLFGQLLHLDGSDHEWLALRPSERQVLLLVVDDATGLNLTGRLEDAETTKNCMQVMRQVVEDFGIPAQLYTDRHSIYWRSKNGKVDAFEHLDGTYSVVWKGRVIGCYDPFGNHYPMTKGTKKPERPQFDRIVLPPRGQTSTALQTKPTFQFQSECI